MKDFIEKSGLTASQFAKKYDIPYNTVRQWAEGIRKAPAWLVKLFKAEKAQKPLTEEVINEKKYYLHYLNNDLSYIYKELDEAKKWHSFSSNVTKSRISEIKEITVKTEKIIMFHENL